MEEDSEYFKKQKLNENFAALYKKDISKLKYADIMQGKLSHLNHSDSCESHKIKKFEDGISFIEHKKEDE